MSLTDVQDTARQGRALRTVSVVIRMTPEEKSTVQKNAKDSHSTLARYIRESALGRTNPLPAINIEDRVALARVGNNLNQLARKLNSGDRVSAEDLQQEISDCRKILAGISEKL